LWVEDHWSDATGEAGDQGNDVVTLETHVSRRGQRLRDRAERARLFNQVLQSAGLSLQDWEGSSYILRDAKGRSAVVNNLAQVWPEAEVLAGRPLDPLDRVFLQRLRDQRRWSR